MSGENLAKKANKCISNISSVWIKRFLSSRGLKEDVIPGFISWAGWLLGHLIISMGVPVIPWVRAGVFVTYAQRMWEADLICCCVYSCCCVRELSTHISVLCTWVCSSYSCNLSAASINTWSKTARSFLLIVFSSCHPKSDPPSDLMSANPSQT